MHAEQIKASIRMAGTTPAILADELGVARATMSQVIHGRSRSARIERRIAEVVGRPASQIWTDRPTSLTRRSQS